MTKANLRDLSREITKAIGRTPRRPTLSAGQRGQMAQWLAGRQAPSRNRVLWRGKTGETVTTADVLELVREAVGASALDAMPRAIARDRERTAAAKPRQWVYQNGCMRHIDDTYEIWKGPGGNTISLGDLLSCVREALRSDELRPLMDALVRSELRRRRR